MAKPSAPAAQTVINPRFAPLRFSSFSSVTVSFEAQSQAQLDAIYRELTAHELVLMAL